MSENPEVPAGPTPEEIAAAERLERAKANTIARIVSHMNGVGASIEAAYPILEQKTWTIQKLEAEKVLPLIAAGAAPAAVFEAASHITRVCHHHHGAATDAERVGQVQVKAQIALGLSETFLEVSAFVNGLRARVSDQIAAATSQVEVDDIEVATHAELGQFRSAHGV